MLKAILACPRTVYLTSNVRRCSLTRSQLYTNGILQCPSHSSLPRPPHLSLLADQCTSVLQLKQIHAQLITSSRVHDNFALSRLLSFCALSESGDLGYALKLFDFASEPNSFMWNTLIRAQANGSNPKDGIFLYINMRRNGVEPGKHTFPFLLKACYNYCSLECVQQVHGHVLKFGLDLDLHVVNGLLRGYSVLGDMSGGRRVFDESRDRDLSIWTTLICGYAQNFMSNKALALFNDMIEDGFEPNNVTLASVLSACARSSCLDLGGRIHGLMKEKGIGEGVILGTALVHMYARNGEILAAQELFHNMKEKNIATWNAMICGMAVHGHAKDALDLFHKMEEEHIVPNDVTFVGVLSACCHAGLVDLGRSIFESMEVYRVEPKLEHYSCMVDLLGRAGKVEEAEKLIKSMVWKPDVVILGALLGACKSHGNVEIAERVVNEILKLEPHNHGVHVVLSNMYAEAGRWADVQRLRKKTNQGNLKKLRGWSAVEALRVGQDSRV